MKNFNIMGVHRKIQFLIGFTKKKYIVELPKKEAWKVCRFKGGLAKKREWCF